MMAGVTTVSAQDEGWKDPEQWVEVTADMWHQWGSEADPTHCKKDAVITGDMTPAWNLNSDIGAGACVLGAENVTWNLYADITEYEKLIIFGTGGPGMRVMCNRIIDEGAWKNMAGSGSGEGGAEGVETGDERVDYFVHLHCF